MENYWSLVKDETTTNRLRISLITLNNRVKNFNCEKKTYQILMACDNMFYFYCGSIFNLRFYQRL